MLPRAALSLVVVVFACSGRGGAPPPAGPTTGPTGPTNEAAASPATPPTSPPDATTRPRLALDPGEFGGTVYGFTQGVTANGRYVLLRRFASGKPPRFGQHGEASEEPELLLVDRVHVKERRILDVIEMDEAARYVLLVEHGQVVLADSETGIELALAGADLATDGNSCLPPRMAALSPQATRVGWVRAPDTFVVRELDGGAEWTVTASARLWRGWPLDDAEAAVLATVPAGSTGWPQQHTSCACRWCGRFAMSQGFYGWGPPAFGFEQVGADGKRQPAKGPPQAPAGATPPATSGAPRCKAEPTSKDGSLERGPWRVTCE